MDTLQRGRAIVTPERGPGLTPRHKATSLLVLAASSCLLVVILLWPVVTRLG
jgi:hypothetical protein